MQLLRRGWLKSYDSTNVNAAKILKYISQCNYEHFPCIKNTNLRRMWVYRISEWVLVDKAKAESEMDEPLKHQVWVNQLNGN